jgi:branched-chain amino acid transport system ATP-binding protein
MLQVQGLHAYYGDSHVLRGVDLDVPEATAVGLLGRNGMGKTTLIRSVMGYVPARSGTSAWRAPGWVTCPRGVASSRT